MSSDESVRGQTLPGPVNLAHLDGVLEGAAEQKLLMSLDIYEEAVFRTTYRDGRAVATDEVSPLELAQALASIDAGTGVLPPDTLFYRQSGGGYHLAVYLPPAIRPLRLDGEPEPVAVPLPPLVFAGRGTDYHVYALATGEWPAARTPLYHAPFPNVHARGRICSGSVVFPACRPETIHRAAGLFFESRFNQDLARNKSQKHENIVELWRELDEARIEQYPLDDLVEMGQALGDLFQE